jgi:signal transduction histidine kinase
MTPTPPPRQSRISALRQAPAASITLLDSSALIAGVLACALPLLAGLIAGWSVQRIGGYLVLAILYLVLVQQNLSPSTRIGHWFCAHQPVYLTVIGLITTALLALSGDYLLQPIAFTIPFVQGLLALGQRSGPIVGGAYLSLMGLGLWLGGQRSALGIAFPLAVYGALMVFMAAFVRLAQDQQAARHKADELAAALAHERDTLAALAAENARLADQAGAAAALAERNRIARELHDTIAQGLTAVTMQLEAAQRAFDRDPERARTRLSRAHELARETLTDVRTSVWTLAGPLAAGASLQEALEAQVVRFQQRTGIVARYTHSGAPIDLSDDRAGQIVRIVQEALTNAEKHAAAATISVHSQHTNGTTEIHIHDDGNGFDPSTPRSSAHNGGFGLTSMHERARLAGATLLIDSAPGAGTTVRLVLPDF